MPAMLTYFELPLERIPEEQVVFKVVYQVPLFRSPFKTRAEEKTSPNPEAVRKKDFIKKYNQFISEVNQDIKILNKYIKEYNSEINKAIAKGNEDIEAEDINPDAMKLEKLQTIFLFRETMLRKYSDLYINRSTIFQNRIQRNLFYDIQTQATLLGLPSLCDLATVDPQKPLKTQPMQPTFAEFLTNMPQKKAEQMLSIFVKVRPQDRFLDCFHNLYAAHEEGFVLFQQLYLNIQSVVFCEEPGCTLKVVLKTPETEEPGKHLFLKCEARHGNPLANEYRLRKDSDLQDCFLPILAERQVTNTRISTATNKTITITRTLRLMPACDHGNLWDYGNTLAIEERFELAPDIFMQIGTIIKKIMQKGFWHSDLKLRYFLLDNKTVYLGNGKALLDFLKNGTFSFCKAQLENSPYSFLSTDYLKPPEYQSQTFPVPEAQAYLFGKMLYHFLTLCSRKVLLENPNGKTLDFSHRMFQDTTGPIGPLLAYIIQETIQMGPGRMPIHEAIMALDCMDLELTKAKRKIFLQLVTIRESIFEKSLKEAYFKEFTEKIDAAKMDDLPLIDQTLQRIIGTVIPQWQHLELTKKQSNCHNTLRSIENSLVAPEEKQQFQEEKQIIIQRIDTASLKTIDAISIQINELFVNLVIKRTELDLGLWHRKMPSKLLEPLPAQSLHAIPNPRVEYKFEFEQ